MRSACGLIAVFFLISLYGQSQSQPPADANCRKNMEIVDRAFAAFDTWSNKTSAFYFQAIKAADAVLKACPLEAATRRAIIIRKSILNFFGFCMLDEQESKLLKKPLDKKAFFEAKLDSLRNFKDSSYQVYIDYLSGFYYAFIDGKYRLAINYFQDALSKRGDWDVLLNELALSYIWLTKNDSAKLYADKCIAVNPKYTLAYVTAGHVVGGTKNINAALNYFRKALLLDPRCRSALLEIGYWYDRCGNEDSARDYYNKALDVSPDYITALTNLARFQTEDSAIALYRRCLDINPFQPDIYMWIGNLLNTEDQYERKINNYNHAIALDSSYLYLLGIVEHNRGNYEKAIDYYKQSLKYGEDQWTLRNIGTCYLVLGKYKESIEYLNKALDIDSNYSEVQYKLASLYDTTSFRDKLKARYYYKKAFAADSANHQKYYSFVAFDTLSTKDTAAAFNFFYEGYKNGCEKCLAYANALMYEHGYNNVERDYEEAKEWYSYILRRDNDDFAWNSLINLYLGDKINADYKDWEKSNGESMEEIPIACVNQNNSDTTFVKVKVYDYYPEGIHPLLWAGLRLIKEYNYTIPTAEREQVQTWYTQSQLYGLSFSWYLKYSQEVEIQKKEKDHFADEAHQIENEKNDSKKIALFDALVERTNQSLIKMPEDKVVMNLASQANIWYGKYLVERGNLDGALQKFRMAIQLNPVDSVAIASATSINFSKNGKNPEQLIENTRPEEDLAYITLYFDQGDKKNADFIYKKLIAGKKQALIKKRLYELYLERGYDNFDEIFLNDPSEIGYYRDYFSATARNTLDTVYAKNGYKNTTRLDEAMLKPNGDDSFRVEMARDYNSLGWYALLSKDYVTAKAAVIRGLQLDKNNLYLQGNLPHTLLFTGQIKKATDLYLKLKDEPFDSESGFSSFKEAFAQDFKDFRKANISDPRIGKIKTLLHIN